MSLSTFSTCQYWHSDGSCGYWAVPYGRCVDAANCPWREENKAELLHKLCTEQGIEKAYIVFKDGVAYDYLWLSDKEFQLSRVGDCATNYIVP